MFYQKLYSKLPVILFDAACIPLAWYGAFFLRFNMQFDPDALFSNAALQAICLLFIMQVGGFYYFKIYRGLWRFFSLSDVFRIVKSVSAATVLLIPLLYLLGTLNQIPRSVFPLYTMLLSIMLASSRLTRRIYFDKKLINITKKNPRHVLVIGAGQAGESLVRDLKRSNQYQPVGLIDDSTSKRGLEIHGIRVLGVVKELKKLVDKYAVDLVLIAIPSAKSSEMRRIVQYCEQAEVEFRTLPGLSDLASGRVALQSLRPVKLDDLLGRDQVHLDWDRIANNIYGRRIAVTGGGGSIGSELCRQIISLQPEQLLVLDNSEFNLYKIELELKMHGFDQKLQIALADITDRVAIEYFFGKFCPEIVFHAAAFKHVPMLESQVRVAVQNNILGTRIVAESSVAIGVEKFILISTDKAVNPTNIMGTTKRVAEIYCQNLNAEVDTKFITVRFGNVLGSAGSVVPLFQQQLEAGGPLTVTHPDIERYFMTIPEASQLILQAMVSGSGGEIFVLDMGEPIKIRYLAEQIIKLSGKEPGQDIMIQYTGLRPGEKLYEEIFHSSEQLTETEHEKLLKAKYRAIDWVELMQSMRMFASACETHNQDELIILLKSLVPEFDRELLMKA